jgi:hypothetical protein
LAHLCYIGTCEPHKQIKPHPGIFLEFAPVERSWAHPTFVNEYGKGLPEYSSACFCHLGFQHAILLSSHGFCKYNPLMSQRFLHR